MTQDIDEISQMRSPAGILRNVGLGSVLVLVLVACGGSSSGPSGSTTTTSSDGSLSDATSTVSVENAGDSDAEPSDPLTPQEQVAAAVDDLVQSGAYAFTATVTLAVKGTQIESELEGWVDGADRQITLKIDDAETTTRVIDGVATVERDGEVTEVPLTEAPDAPSLEILKSIRNVAFVDGGVEGKFSGNDLVELGYEINGSALATVLIAADGTLDGYKIAGTNESWVIIVSFSA